MGNLHIAFLLSPFWEQLKQKFEIYCLGYDRGLIDIKN